MAPRALILAVLWSASLVACGSPDYAFFGSPPDAGVGDGGSKAERLARVSLSLRGSWTGQATVFRGPFETQSPWDIRWEPDADEPQSGSLIMGCFSKEACAPIPGSAPPGTLHLVDIDENGVVTGLLEGYDVFREAFLGERGIAFSVELQITEPKRLNFKVDFLDGTFEQISLDPTQPPIPLL